MGNYKTVNGLRLNYYSVSVILVLTCVSSVLGNSSTTMHDQFSTQTSIAASTELRHHRRQRQSTTGVNSTHSGLLFNIYVDMQWFRYIFSRLVTILNYIRNPSATF